MLRPRCIPGKLVADAMHELNPVVADLADRKDHFTEAEFEFLSWYARLHLLMRPYLGVIPLPEPKETAKRK